MAKPVAWLVEGRHGRWPVQIDFRDRYVELNVPATAAGVPVESAPPVLLSFESLPDLVSALSQALETIRKTEARR